MPTTLVSIDGQDAIQVDFGAVRLRVLAGPDAGLARTFDTTPVLVGKGGDCDLVLTDPQVSRRHLEVVEVPEGLRLRDLGSTNGTFLADARVDEVLLERDGTLRLGETTLSLELVDSSHQALVDEGEDSGLIGASEAMRHLRAAVAAAGPSRANVMVLGESGTGKELIARALHEASGRPGGLVVFDGSTADPTTLRSDLFGHVKGAFTGADKPRDGAIRKADGGTLFLDEIGELPLDLQGHLLRVLESRRVRPMGADDDLPVDVRVVAATHRDLRERVQAGEFRLDLYHRLAVLVLDVPPLRDRLEDLPQLVEALAAREGLACRFDDAAWEAMRAHPWPGNVRELRNVLERAAVMAAGREATPRDLALEPAPPPARRDASLQAANEVSERAAIVEALEAEGGVRQKAAERLGISPATLWRKMKRLEI